MDEHAADRPMMEYERAVCYYTLPRVVTPLSAGLIAAYGVCLLEAVAALVYGLVSGDATWIQWGTICLAGVIVLGVVVFLARAFLNEVRKRQLFATAQTVADPTSGFDDLPDPFEGHTLLKKVEKAEEKELDIQDREGNRRYTVRSEGRGQYNVYEGASERVLYSVTRRRRGVSFTVETGIGGDLLVTRNGEPVARVRERFSLRGSRYDIIFEGSPGPNYTIRAGSIYASEVLVGRVYTFRHHDYLDIQSAHEHPAVLAYFIVFA